MHLESELDIKLHFSIFNKDVLVAGGADGYLKTLAVGFSYKYGILAVKQFSIVVHVYFIKNRSSGVYCIYIFSFQFLQIFGFLKSQKRKTDFIAGMKLPELPELSRRRAYGADKAAETWTVRTEKYGLISCKIHCPYGISVVMDIGWMKSGFTAVGSCPLGHEAVKSYAGSR